MIPILFEDNHCLALDKPAGLLSQGDATGDRSILDLARDDIRRRYDKPGNVFVGLVHRLDRPVSGVVVLAKTSKAAARLSTQFREHQVEKVYLAVVEGTPLDAEGEWFDWLAKDARENRVSVVERGEHGKAAGLAYEVLDRGQGLSLLRLRPTTGRGHQLRVQLSSRGLPIVGDRKYGAKSPLRALDGGFRIALHAEHLAFNHPTRDERISVSSPVPADWPRRFCRN
ncbi:MAG: rluC [Planctomycetota bacterium]|nr:rluC [Planctomycetota bacterium]